MKFASFTQTFRYKNTSPNILINWRLHVTNYFTTICQDMSFLACTCIISVMEYRRTKESFQNSYSLRLDHIKFKERKESKSLNLKVNACKSKLKNPRHVCKVGDKIVFKILIFDNSFHVWWGTWNRDNAWNFLLRTFWQIKPRGKTFETPLLKKKIISFINFPCQPLAATWKRFNQDSVFYSLSLTDNKTNIQDLILNLV